MTRSAKQRLELLVEASLEGLAVGTTGDPAALQAACPQLRTLSVAHTLFRDWAQVR